MSLTKIDWLGFRTQDGPATCVEALRGAFGSLGRDVRATPKKRGKQGFERSDALSVGDLVIGDMSFGGEAMRGWVWIELTGKGCEWVEDWEKCEEDIAQLRSFQYKRVDIALDTFHREVTHETVVKAHTDGLFTTGGKPPSMRQIVPADPYEGRTAYVGKRDQPKFLRAYEKGFETVQQFPRHFDIHTIDGVVVADWYRLELELKAKHQPLPEDLIENRDQFFAGAYPYLQSVLSVEPEVLKLSRDKQPRRRLAAMLDVMREQYGNTLFTALAAHHGDIGAVWEKIVGSKHNQNLLEDGVLMVDHD
jgi:phage replication initiation protein